MSDLGLDASLGQYIEASVSDFPVMTELARLLSYLFYGPFQRYS